MSSSSSLPEEGSRIQLLNYNFIILTIDKVQKNNFTCCNILIFRFSDRRQEDKNPELNGTKQLKNFNVISS
jgi:hypothetical protein